jgi:hypothetical protein
MDSRLLETGSWETVVAGQRSLIARHNAASSSCRSLPFLFLQCEWNSERSPMNGVQTKTKNCIFCDSRQLTREHLWSEWTYKFFPKRRDGRHKRILFKTAPHDRKLWSVEQNAHRQGDTSSIRVRCVCQRCNNGWMSQLEELAKPALEKLITGSPIVLSDEQQEHVSAWIALKIMVSEYGSFEGPITTQPERSFLMLRRKAPVHWQVWISMHQAHGWRSGYRRGCATLAFVPRGETPSAEQSRNTRNTQFVLFGIGKLLFTVFSSRTGAQISFPSHLSTMIRPIAPSVGSVIWPPLAILHDTVIDYGLAEVFNRYLDGLQWARSPEA